MRIVPFFSLALIWRWWIMHPYLSSMPVCAQLEEVEVTADGDYYRQESRVDEDAPTVDDAAEPVASSQKSFDNVNDQSSIDEVIRDDLSEIDVEKDEIEEPGGHSYELQHGEPTESPAIEVTNGEANNEVQITVEEQNMETAPLDKSLDTDDNPQFEEIEDEGGQHPEDALMEVVEDKLPESNEASQSGKAKIDPSCPDRDHLMRCAKEYLDKNKNNMLERSELEAAIDALPWYAKGVLKILGSVDRIMKKCDVDGDGAISIDYDMKNNQEECLATCFKRRAFKGAFFANCDL